VGWGEGASPLDSDLSAQNRGEAPSPSSLRSSTSPRTRGEVNKRLHSRANSLCASAENPAT
jgi:hypothetical protein